MPAAMSTEGVWLLRPRLRRGASPGPDGWCSEASPLRRAIIAVVCVGVGVRSVEFFSLVADVVERVFVYRKGIEGEDDEFVLL